MPLRKLFTRLSLFGIAFLSALILTGCACGLHATKIEPIEARWLCNINLNSNLWMQCADAWFVTGRPNAIEKNLRASTDRATTLMTVDVADFDKIVVNGSFQVQIVGAQPRNSVYVFGSNLSSRQTSVHVRGRTLFVSQPVNSTTVFDKTIVRIGVRHLSGLSNLGCGNIYGRGIVGQFPIFSAGSGNIMLMGNMNVQQIRQLGPGTITLFGANTPCLGITAIGNGNVKVCGHVGVRMITHRGNGSINILGADSPSLKIVASGCGLTTVVGVVNLKKVVALNSSRVYLYWVNGDRTSVFADHCARVALAGSTHVLDVTVNNSANFEGQYLQSNQVYVRTNYIAHASVATPHRLFAEANANSSIYYFDEPKEVSDFRHGNGIIIPIQHLPCPCMPRAPMMKQVVKNYKAEVVKNYKTERVYHPTND